VSGRVVSTRRRKQTSEKGGETQKGKKASQPLGKFMESPAKERARDWKTGEGILRRKKHHERKGVHSRRDKNNS